MTPGLPIEFRAILSKAEHKGAWTCVYRGAGVQHSGADQHALGLAPQGVGGLACKDAGPQQPQVADVLRHVAQEVLVDITLT